MRRAALRGVVTAVAASALLAGCTSKGQDLCSTAKAQLDAGQLTTAGATFLQAQDAGAKQCVTDGLEKVRARHATAYDHLLRGVAARAEGDDVAAAEQFVAALTSDASMSEAADALDALPPAAVAAARPKPAASPASASVPPSSPAAASAAPSSPAAASAAPSPARAAQASDDGSVPWVLAVLVLGLAVIAAAAFTASSGAWRGTGGLLRRGAHGRGEPAQASASDPAPRGHLLPVPDVDADDARGADPLGSAPDVVSLPDLDRDVLTLPDAAHPRAAHPPAAHPDGGPPDRDPAGDDGRVLTPSTAVFAGPGATAPVLGARTTGGAVASAPAAGRARTWSRARPTGTAGGGAPPRPVPSGVGAARPDVGASGTLVVIWCSHAADTRDRTSGRVIARRSTRELPPTDVAGLGPWLTGLGQTDAVRFFDGGPAWVSAHDLSLNQALVHARSHAHEWVELCRRPEVTASRLGLEPVTGSVLDAVGQPRAAGARLVPSSFGVVCAAVAVVTTGTGRVAAGAHVLEPLPLRFAARAMIHAAVVPA